MHSQIISPLVANNIPSFLSKTKSILKNPQYQNVISWDQDGKIIKVLNMKQMETKILPKEFRHGNYNSFVRQLNMYGFKKLKKRSHGIAFFHPLFSRDDIDENMILIKRKKNSQKIESSQETKCQTGFISFEKISKPMANADINNTQRQIPTLIDNSKINQYFPAQVVDPYFYYQNFWSQNKAYPQYLMPIFPFCV